MNQSNPNPFPLNATLIEDLIDENNLNLSSISIRELNRLVDELTEKCSVEFLRFEFGIPGLIANRMGPEEEIRILNKNPSLPSTYPPFDGVPRLKKATALFCKKFMNIDVQPENCLPTVGAMHGCFISQAISARRKKNANTILFLDPGFPVNKLQAKFLGLNVESVDLYNYRGEELIDKLEKLFSTGTIGGVIWSSPNNPSWICLKEIELKGIGDLLTKYDVIGIEDIAYFGMDFRYDYSVPGSPPYQPTIATYTDNYFIIISSSKIFSYAGQRVAVTIISPGLMNKKYSYLKAYFNTEKVGNAFIHGGLYPTTAGVAQTPQIALASYFEAASNGQYDFLSELKIYAERAKKAKNIFLKYGFDLAYSKDMEEQISDGFYFTIKRQGFNSDTLLYHMLRFGLAGIPLNTTGSTIEGVRICVSLIRSDQFEELEFRVRELNSFLIN